MILLVKAAILLLYDYAKSIKLSIAEELAKYLKLAQETQEKIQEKKIFDYAQYTILCRVFYAPVFLIKSFMPMILINLPLQPFSFL